MSISRGNKSPRNDVNSTTTTLTWASAPTAGQKVIVVVWGSYTSTPTVSDNGSPSRTFTLAASKTDSGNTLGVWIFYADNVQPSGTYSVTVTFGSSNSWSAGGIAYSGVAAGGPSATNTNNGTGTTFTTGAVSNAANALYFGGYVNNAGGADTLSVGGGFTNQFNLDSGATFDEGAGADLINSTGSQNCRWTDSTVSRTWSACIATWSEAVSGGGYLGFGPSLMQPPTVPGGLFQQFLPPILAAGPVTVPVTLSVSTSSAVTMTRTVGKQLIVSTSSTSSLTKQVGKVLSESTASTVSLLKTVGKTLSVSTTSTVTLTKLVSKVLSVATSSTATLTKSIGKVLSVATSSTVTLTAIKTKIVTLAVNTASSVTMVRTIGKNLAVSTTSQVSMRRSIGKVLSVATAPAASMVKTIAKTLQVNSASAVSVLAVKLGEGIGGPVSGPTRLLGQAVNRLLGAASNRLRGGGPNQLGGE
jgi:hypothetical protein